MLVSTVVLVLCLAFSGASAQTKYTEANFTFVVSLDQAAIVDYCGADSDLIIPDHLAGFPVTRICLGAFRGCKTLKTVTIPASVISIGESVPDENGYVQPLEIFNPIPLIGWNCGTIVLRQACERSVFYNCPCLTDIYLPPNIESIFQDAFFQCSAHLHYDADSLTEQAILKANERPKRSIPKPTRTPRKKHTTPDP